MISTFLFIILSWAQTIFTHKITLHIIFILFEFFQFALHQYFLFFLLGLTYL